MGRADGAQHERLGEELHDQAPAAGADAKANTSSAKAGSQQPKAHDSVDSKQEEYVFNNIDHELEQDNKLRNRKYFVYVVHDGHFTAKKECIARIELPPKRRITLAELRQLISSSQDISLSSLRRNRFKFVTETYRLLNENEDAAVLHQVYPTQGVFLKLNVTDNQETHAYHPCKSNARLNSARLSSSEAGGGGPGSALLIGGGGGGPAMLAAGASQATIASRRRQANARPAGRRLNAAAEQQEGRSNALPAIDAGPAAGQQRARARGRPAPVAYPRSKSSLQVGARRGAAGRQRAGASSSAMRRGQSSTSINEKGAAKFDQEANQLPPLDDGKSAGRSLGAAASDLGANVISGAKKLFNFSSSSSLSTKK